MEDLLAWCESSRIGTTFGGSSCPTVMPRSPRPGVCVWRAASSRTAGRRGGRPGGSRCRIRRREAGPGGATDGVWRVWPTARRGRARARGLRPGGWSGGSWAASSAPVGRPGSGPGSGSRRRRWAGCWRVTGCRGWLAWTGPPGRRCAATNAPTRGRWCPWTGKKLGPIPDGGGHRAAGSRGRTQQPNPPGRGLGVHPLRPRRPCPTGLLRDPPG